MLDVRDDCVLSRSTHPGEVEMWLVVAADTVIDDLQFLGSLHGHAGHVLYAFAHRRHMLVLVFLKPRALADSVICYLQGAGLIILHRGALKLQTNAIAVISGISAISPFASTRVVRRALPRPRKLSNIFVPQHKNNSSPEDTLYALRVRVYLP